MNVTIHTPSWAKFIVSDFTDMDRSPQTVKNETLSFELPDDAYFEYAFLDAEDTMQLDPTNSTKAENPWFPNASAILALNYKADIYANPTVKAEGYILRPRIESKHLQQTRRIITYTPKGYEHQALPVIYVQDGVAYYRIAKLAEVLEQLLSESLLKPAHLVFIEPIDRMDDYRFNASYRAFITDELIQLIDKELKTTIERMAMGASLGGLMSATLALEHPELFQTVITQSGAFLGSPTEPDFYKGKSSWVLETLENSDRLPLRWYTETGTIEWLTDINRKVHEVLEQKNYDHAYAERNAGHNWTNWRNGLGNALKFALK
ncbi:MAG: alpha/beta hydrolase [Trueperaceae bacterium]